MKIWSLLVLMFLSSATSGFAVIAAPLYTQPASVVDSGGGVSSSPGYENLGAIGQPIVGLSTGAGGSNHAGFIPVLGASGILWPIIGFDPANFTFTFFIGEPAPAAQGLNLTNTGGSTLEWHVTRTSLWLTLTPLSGTGPGSVTVGILTTGLTPGVYPDTITISATGAENNGVTIPVTLTVSPTYELTLTFASPTTPAGGGYVTVTNNETAPPAIITCTGTPNPCKNFFHAGAPLVLKAYPNDDSLLTSWSGACSGGTCSVTMSANRDVTATFSYVKPVMIDGATPQYYNTLREAYDAASTIGQVVIKARKFVFDTELKLDLVKNIKILGGYDASFATQSGYTLLPKLTVGKGSLVTDRLTVK
jgi:hypothetical protein